MGTSSDKGKKYSDKKIIETDINTIKNELSDANMKQIKKDISYIKEKISHCDCDEIKKEISSLKLEILEIKKLLIQLIPHVE